MINTLTLDSRQNADPGPGRNGDGTVSRLRARGAVRLPILIVVLVWWIGFQPARAQLGDHEAHDAQIQDEAHDAQVQHEEDPLGLDGADFSQEISREDPASRRASPEEIGSEVAESLPEKDHLPSEMKMERGMASLLQPALPMTQDGSGTSWTPARSPLHAYQQASGAWRFMLHGNAWLRYNAQDAFNSGTRGDSQFDVPNWLMGMAQRPLSRSSQIGFRAMLSLDPAIVGGRGYPLLFQTGETFEGDPLIDRQHPHDLFAELAVVYGQDLGNDWGVFGYFGFPGEPALGPPVYLHRPSAVHLPDAPLGHHWQDATHIVFGTATVGVRYGTFKLDGSIFTGREPDEERFGFDRPRFDSYSGRLTVNPSARWSLQVSRAFLREPELLHPGQSQWRTSASAMYVAPAPIGSGTWATTAVWGLNQRTASGGADDHGSGLPLLHSLLVESDLQFGRQAVYGRGEWVQKPADELGLGDFEHIRTFIIKALSLGLSREILQLGEFKVDVGGHATLFAVPSGLKETYGNRPMSLQVYLRLSPTAMTMH